MSQTTATVHNPHTNFSGSEGIYLLPHNQQEIVRLQTQHRSIKAATKGALTSVPVPAEAVILDSGCADGTWLVDLGNSQPNRQGMSLHGVDIGSALFPNHPELDLRQHDIRTPFPADWGWKNHFALVHQRLLVWGLGIDDWSPALKTLTDAVRPGGFIHLVEGEWVLPSYTHDQPEQQKLSLIQEWSGSSQGMDVHIWRKLPAMLAAQGFVDVQVESYSFGYGKTTSIVGHENSSTELLINTFKPLLARWPKGGIKGVAETPEQYEAFLEALKKEVRSVGYTPRLKWIVARKPDA